MISQINIQYINLDERLDRRSEIESELNRLSIINFSRFSAIKATPGILGCSLSHLEIFKNADRTKPLFVLEDDCEFLVSKNELDRLIEYFMKSQADIFCLAYNIPKKRIQNLIRIFRYNLLRPSLWKLIWGPIKRAAKIQTMSCYILKPHMIDILENLSEQCVKELKDGFPAHHSAIDQKWKSLQKKYVFVIPRIRAAKQRASFSNIENSFKNYGV
jgi:hypothetical protein